ncbi:MAG: STAS domain-containing protein [Acidobacteriota bacterium]
MTLARISLEGCTVIVEKSRREGLTILTIEGIIKLGESAQFLAQTLDRALENDEGHVILDLEKINYIDSTGIGELVGYLGRFQNRDRKLILVKASDRILKLLEMSQLDRIFPIYNDLDAAVAAET